MATFTTNIPPTHSGATVALADLPNGPVRSVVDMSDPASAGGFPHYAGVRVSVLLVTGGGGVEVDKFYSRYPKSDAVKYTAQHGAQRDADVVAQSADSWSFGLLTDAVVIADA